jgi:hypothetical protein
VRRDEIFAGRAYVNGSGRNERFVLEIGFDVPVKWRGKPDGEPKDMPGVRYLETRLGKTLYRDARGERTVYLSTFADWANWAVDVGKEAPRA